MLMPILGAVAAFGLARSGKLFVRAVIGMALGFTYFVADNFALAMGSLGAYPPFLAAWAPFLLFLMIGEAVLIRRSEEHTSELQSLMRISYAVFCLKKNNLQLHIHLYMRT